MLEATEVACPYCGEPTLVFPDPTAGSRQELIEDCQVCCQPISFRVEWRGGRARVVAQRMD